MEYIMYLEMGPVIYRMQAQEPMKVMEEYQEFFYSSREEIPEANSKRMIICELKRVENFANLRGSLVHQNPERLIFSYEGLEQRVHMMDGNVYGIYRQISDSRIEIELQKDMIPELKLTIVLLEMLAADYFLLKEDAMVLHSSFIQWQGKGILFTAPSGTGKSTQAELWRKYAEADVMNGDRSIIYWNQKKQEFWVAGLPFCGSSRICRNCRMPLEAIVFLNQAEENKAEIFPKAQAAGRLFGEMSINQWNRDSVENGFQWIERITDSVKMIHFSCNMDPDAVFSLRDFLKTL